jgi:hypothetical protein
MNRSKFYATSALAMLFCSTLVIATEMVPLPVHDGHVHEGVASCASSNCHGAVKEFRNSNIRHNEYITWDRQDVHSDAYAKMLGKEFKDITDKLGLKSPQYEPVCLACHASSVAMSLRGKKFQLSDGIGCETCHGGAQNWLATHTDKAASHASNVANGLYPNADLLQRTRLCMSCHYGNSQQFVSHEIMGAGHPRISFEMDTFSELQPPHFVQDDDYKKRKTPYSNVQVWAVGQVVAAESVLAMLKSDHMKPGRLFPELSLFDCHSCHHPMSDKSWTPRPGTGLGPGIVPINDASLLMLRHVMVPIAAGEAWRFRKLLQELHAAATTGYENLIVKVDEMQQIVAAFSKAIRAHEFTAGDIKAITLSLMNEGVWGEYKDYVAAEQAVMAISALTISWDRLAPFADARRSQIKTAIDKLYLLVENEEAYQQRAFSDALRALRDVISGS